MSDIRYQIRVKTTNIQILVRNIKCSEYLEVHAMSKSIRRLEARTELCPMW